MKLILLIVFSGFFCYLNSAIIYVSQTGSGSLDGSSWANAFPADSLQSAINSAAPGDQIWVACGTYYPTTLLNRVSSFSMRDSVEIYGGFQGTETMLSQRSLSCGSCSVLSGDIGNPGDSSDNSYTVIYNNQLDSSAILDGFYIMFGNDDRSPTSAGNGLGGGIYNHGYGFGNYSNPTLRNCIFERNTASWGGGAFNNAYNSGYSHPTYINCIFYNNHAYIEAGGMDTYAVGGDGAPTVINSIFYENTAATNVGAMYVWGGNAGGSCHPILINTAFINNHALNGYGGAFISDNLDENLSTSSGNASVTLRNCIAWGNTATTTGQQFYIRGTGAEVNAFNSSIDTSNQIFPHQLSGSSTGNIYTNPMFLNIANAIGLDNCWLTADDGLQLTSSSPCVDSGNNSYNNISNDIVGNTRIDGGIIDIGPYEFQQTTSTFSSIKKQIIIFPNPAKNTINILGQDLNGQYAIFNTKGEKVLSGTLNGKSIDIGNLNNGYYYLKTAEGTKKIVIIKD